MKICRRVMSARYCAGNSADKSMHKIGVPSETAWSRRLCRHLYSDSCSTKWEMIALPKPPGPMAGRPSCGAKAEAIMRSASFHFGEKGFGCARIADIARDAEVTKATIYAWHESKEGLFRAVLLRMIDSLPAPRQLSWRQHGSSDKNLEEVARELWELTGTPAMANLNRMLNGPGAPSSISCQALWNEIVQGYVRETEFNLNAIAWNSTRNDLNCSELALGLVQMMVGARVLNSLQDADPPAHTSGPRGAIALIRASLLTN